MAEKDGPSSAAWSIARERTKLRPDGGIDDAGILWVPLDRPMRTDVLARYVQAELDLGTPASIVRDVVSEHGAFHDRTIRYGVGAKLTRIVNERERDEREGATFEPQRDRGDFDDIAALIDRDPHAALGWLQRGDARITPEEKRVLIEDAEAMLRALHA